MPAFPLGRSLGNIARRTWNTSWSTAISDSSAGSSLRRTKQGRRCTHSTWSLDDLWAAFPWVWPAELALPVFCGTFWTHDRTNVAVICQFGEVVQHSGLWEFHNGVLYREVSHQWRNDGGRGHNASGANHWGR